MENKIVISNRYGQLCNRLVQFANLIAFSKKFNTAIFNPFFKDYAKNFEYFEGVGFPVYPKDAKVSKKELWLIDKKSRAFAFFFQRKKCVLRLLGNLFFLPKCRCSFYFQDGFITDVITEQYFAKYLKSKTLFLMGWLFLAPEELIEFRNEIKKVFTPLKKFKTRAEEIVNNARSNCEVLLGVHIRHGDFKESIKRAYHSNERYLNFMQRAKRIFHPKRVGFLICSDEAIKKKDFDTIDCNIGDGELMVDLHSLSLCDYIIGTESTFGQWASFYGDVPYFTLRDFTKKMDKEDFKIHKQVFPDWFLDVLKINIKKNQTGYEFI